MSGRPGSIRSVIEVEFERPRHIDLVTDPRFITLKRDIFHQLHLRGEILA